MAVTVQEGHIDAAGFIAVVKLYDIGFVKEIGIKDDGSILAMWNGNRGGGTLVQKILNFMPVLVVVIVRKVPVIRGFFAKRS